MEIHDFKFVAVEKKAEEREAPEDLFIHSTFFVLVDCAGRVRGWPDDQGKLHAYFDLEDLAASGHVLSAINQLLAEKPTL